MRTSTCWTDCVELHSNVMHRLYSKHPLLNQYLFFCHSFTNATLCLDICLNTQFLTWRYVVRMKMMLVHTLCSGDHRQGALSSAAAPPGLPTWCFCPGLVSGSSSCDTWDRCRSSAGPSGFGGSSCSSCVHRGWWQAPLARPDRRDRTRPLPFHPLTELWNKN